MQIGFLHAGPKLSGLRRYGELLARGFRHPRWEPTVEAQVAGPLEEQVVSAARQLDGTEITLIQLTCSQNQIDLTPRSDGSPSLLSQFLQHYRGPLAATLHDVNTSAWTEMHSRQLAELSEQLRVIFVFTAADRRKLLGIVPEIKLRTLPHFVEPRNISIPTLAAKKMLGLGEKKVLTVLGHIYKRKGYEIFLHALSELPENYTAVFAGGPSQFGRSQEYFQWLVQDMQSRNLSSRLRITGPLPEDLLNYYLAATDLAVCPFYEAAASGSISTWLSAEKPVLASDLPGLRDYDNIAPGALQFFPVGDADALAETIQKLFTRDFETATLEKLRVLRQELSLGVIAARCQHECRIGLVLERLEAAVHATQGFLASPNIKSVPRPKKFVIVSQARSGTHMLRSMLQQHPGVDTYAELFNDESVDAKMHLHMSTQDILRFLDSSPRGGVPGFVLHLHHGLGRWGDVWQKLVEDRAWRFILVKRNNHLARYISRARARHHGQWVLDRSAKKPQVPPLRVLPQFLKEDVMTSEIAWKFVENLIPADRRLTVTYESLAADAERYWEPILKFLEVEQIPCPQPQTLKVGGRMKEQIANYEELKAAFSQTSLEACFDE